MNILKRGAVILVLTIVLFAPRQSEAMSRTTRIFVLTSTYGVMAGTLTGIASLAFYDSPRSHLRNVAMGASLGLYVGILMGGYMIYFVDDAKDKSKEDMPKADPDNPLNLPDSGEGDGQGYRLPMEAPTLQPLLAYDPITQTGMLGINYRF